MFSAPSSLLPAGVSEAGLRAAVAASSSWRGVLRALGRTSPRLGRELRSACLALDIDFSHFGASRINEAALRAQVPVATSWEALLEGLGLSPQSGSARARVRRQCLRLGLDLSHVAPSPGGDLETGFDARPDPRHLRTAAAAIVAAALTLRGYPVSWPLEPAPYDLVADSGRGLLRIQVKSTTWRQEGAWTCKLTRSEAGEHGRRRSHYSAEDIDYFACVDGDLGVYLIPVVLVEGLSVIYLRAYERFRLAEAEDDLGRADRT